jgi:uncharacterized protein (DUF58 family)
VKLRLLLQLLSPRDIRNGILAVFVTLGGLFLAFVTLYAHRTGNTNLAGYAAAASLVFVLLIMIFVIPPLAKNASKEASQMNLPFEFTSGGAIFVGLIVIVAFAAWNTGNNLLFLVLSFLLSGFIVGFFAGHFCIKKLDIKMRFPEIIFADEPTPITVILTNRKFIFPTFSVITEVRGYEKEKSILLDEITQVLPKKWAARFSKPPIVKHTLDYFLFVPLRKDFENIREHIFTKRGRFLIKDFEISTKFPFGFFRHRQRLPAQEVNLIVFPKIESIETLFEDLPLEIGKLVTNKKGSGQDLLGLREYQPTDDIRRVNWKATARTQRLTVSEFSAEDELRITIIFDNRIVFPREERNKTLRQRIQEEQNNIEPSEISLKFENGIILAASFLSHFAQREAEISLNLNDDEIMFGSGKPHLYNVLRRLSVVEPIFVENESDEELKKQIEKSLDSAQNSHLILITANGISKELAEKVNVVKF